MGCDTERNETMKTEDVIELYEAYRSYVRHEDQLINFRTTWFITFQSVLFGIYGFTGQRLAEIQLKMLESAGTAQDTLARRLQIVSDIIDGAAHGTTAFDGSVRFIRYVMVTTPIIGVAACILGFLSIRAASTAIAGIREKGRHHQGLFDQYHLPEITGGGIGRASRTGHVLGSYLPAIVALFWVFSLLRFSFSIHWGP